MDSPMISISPNNQSKPVYCTPNPVPNIPENNQVSLIDYRCAKIAAFTVEGRQLICLPQAFELFLKHLVGGLHTVYTKLKRLEITPVVCNVEQVRILRGLGAIQPGVNRCKLIAPKEFDILFEDCTNSSARPGRPSKRASLLPGDINMTESMKRAHYDFVNDCVKSNESLSASFRLPYDDDKRFYLRNSQTGICPIGQSNFGFNSILPFGMGSYMMGLFPNNQSLIKQLANIPAIPRLSNKESTLLSKTAHTRMTNSFLSTSTGQSQLFAPSSSHQLTSDSVYNSTKPTDGLKSHDDGRFSTLSPLRNTTYSKHAHYENKEASVPKSKKTVFSIDSLVEESRDSAPTNHNPSNTDFPISASTDNSETDKFSLITTKERDLIRALMQNQIKSKLSV